MPALTKSFTLAAVIAVLCVLMALERWFPLRPRTRPQRPRLLVNGFLSLTAYSAAAVFVKPASMATLGWTASRTIGLLRLITAPWWLELALGFLLLDISFYYWHRINHRVPFLWRFHNVHHIDPDLDASTGFRFHFGEVAFSAGFRIVQVAVIGPALSTFLLYELIFQIETYFHHANLRLPLPVERALGILVVTPRMHGIHHSQFHAETDSNYSVVFSVWDRLHRTYRAGNSLDAITIGVPGYRGPEDNSFASALLMPFRIQRDYWRDKEARSELTSK